MSFISRQLVRFQHVDAAGIVFYPRYFEMANAAVEDYFGEVVGVSFAEMHLERRVGVPTRKIEAHFTAPSRLGDQLELDLTIERVGDTSAAVRTEASCDGQPRFRIAAVLVCVNMETGRPLAWPADMRPTATT